MIITILQRWQVDVLFKSVTLRPHRARLLAASTPFGWRRLAFRIFSAQIWVGYAARQRKEVLWLWGWVYWRAQKFSQQHRGKARGQATCSWDEHTGRFLYSADYSSTYYHLDFAHIQRKNPFFNGQVLIAFDKLRSFDYAQCDMIENCNLHATVIHSNLTSSTGLDVCLKFWSPYHF